jgi:hypothetical protein
MPRMFIGAHLPSPFYTAIKSFLYRQVRGGWSTFLADAYQPPRDDACGVPRSCGVRLCARKPAAWLGRPVLTPPPVPDGGRGVFPTAAAELVPEVVRWAVGP